MNVSGQQGALIQRVQERQAQFERRAFEPWLSPHRFRNNQQVDANVDCF